MVTLKGVKIKITPKFRASRRLRLLYREFSPEMRPKSFEKWDQGLSTPKSSNIENLVTSYDVIRPNYSSEQPVYHKSSTSYLAALICVYRNKIN